MVDGSEQGLETDRIQRGLEKNMAVLNRVLGVDTSFDMICRELEYAGRRFALYFVDGLAKDDIMNQLMRHLSNLPEGALDTEVIVKLLRTHIGYLEVSSVNRMEDVISNVLSGPLILLIDGCEEGLAIDARTYPARNPDEPDIERVVRGARDGFTETLIFNTALTRRRLRDPSLRMEYLRVGKRSKTDICLAYLEDVADQDQVALVRNRLRRIRIDGIPMADKTIEEFAFGNKWNPYPMVRYTERPDVAAVHLLEGHVLIYTDTSPSVMITPTTFFHHVQHAEEYRQKPIVGAYLRWVRFLGMLASVFLLPLWYLIVQNPQLVSGYWEILIPKDKGDLPLFIQFMLAEIGIDLLRMAAIHTPSPLATALGLVAAIMMGEVAVKMGFFTEAVILYLATAVIGTFATPSYEMGMANRLARISLLIAVFLFQIPGFLLGVLFWFLVLASARSLNTPYLWPLVPFNGKALLDILTRPPVSDNKRRAEILSPEDPDRSA